MKDFLQRVLRGRYVTRLEEEVARERTESERLRAENRALLNSLLGTAGFPPVNFPETPAVVASPPRVRRRSWRQFQAEREFDSARDAK